MGFCVKRGSDVALGDDARNEKWKSSSNGHSEKSEKSC